MKHFKTSKSNYYTVKNSVFPKVSVTLTKEQLWKNFLVTWGQMVFDDDSGMISHAGLSEVDFKGLTEIVDKLLVKGDLTSIKKLFSSGYTSMLLGEDAFGHIMLDGIHREVIITDEDNCPMIIPHESINF